MAKKQLEDPVPFATFILIRPWDDRGAERFHLALKLSVAVAAVGVVCGSLLFLFNVGSISEHPSYRLAVAGGLAQIALWGGLSAAMFSTFQDLGEMVQTRLGAKWYGRIFLFNAVPVVVGLGALVLLMPESLIPYPSIDGWRYRTVLFGILGVLAATPGWLSLSLAQIVAWSQNRLALDDTVTAANQLVSEHLRLTIAVTHVRTALGVGLSAAVISLSLFWSAENAYRSQQLAEAQEIVELDAAERQTEALIAEISKVAAAADNRIEEAAAQIQTVEQLARVETDARSRRRANAELYEPVDRSVLLAWTSAIALALVYAYLPTHLAIERARREIVDRYRPLPTLTPGLQAEFQKLADARVTLTQALGGVGTARSALERSAFVLAPLVAASFSAVIS